MAPCALLPVTYSTAPDTLSKPNIIVLVIGSKKAKASSSTSGCSLEATTIPSFFSVFTPNTRSPSLFLDARCKDSLILMPISLSPYLSNFFLRLACNLFISRTASGSRIFSIGASGSTGASDDCIGLS